VSGILHYCGQTAGWMKMPLGTEVDLGPGHIVLETGTEPPSFRPMSIVATVTHLSYCGANKSVFRCLHPMYCDKLYCAVYYNNTPALFDKV